MEHQKLMAKSGNRFELVREVGLTSLKSSRVFLAQDLKTNEPVCLKIAEDRSFEREYKVLEELLQGAADGKVVVPKPYEFGDVDFEETPQHYLSREFLPGIDLLTYFKDYTFKTMEERASAVISVVKDASLIAAYIHSKGKYHRDLKPDDFVKGGKGVCLVDFETVLDEGKECLDRHVVFSAPEVKGSLMVLADHRSDIYSLGKITLALLIACHQEAYKSFIRHSSDYIPRELNERYELRIPPKVLKVIKKATSYQPDERYDTVEKLTKALERAIS